MKKTIVFSGMILILVFAMAGPALAQVRFGFKLGGGLAYAGGGDVNEGLQGWSDVIADMYSSAPGLSVLDGYEPFHLGPDFNGEFFIQINPDIAIGLGAGYLSISKESSLTVTDGSDSINMYWKPKVGVIPLTLNFHYFLPSGGRVRFVLTAGLGLYLASLDLTQTFFSSTEQMKLSATGFGAHGGVGLEIALSPQVSFTADILGRFAQTGGLGGDSTESGSTMTNGKLWYFQAIIPGEGRYPLVAYDQTVPSGADIISPREAKLGLSGFSVVLGFLFRI